MIFNLVLIQRDLLGDTKVIDDTEAHLLVGPSIAR